MTRTLKAAVKTAGAGLMYHSGLLGSMRAKLTVLGYHRVLDGPLEAVTTCPLGMVATPENFERQVAYAARRYKMLSLEDVEQAAETGRPLPEKACLITFDDGWVDNYTVAYPILKRMGVPAVIFVTTDYIDSPRAFWFTPLMESILRSRRGLKRGDGQAAGWPAEAAAELDRVADMPRPLKPWNLDRLVEGMKRWSEAEIEQMVERLTKQLDWQAPEENHFLTWQQLREMEPAGIGVGSHTATHKILIQISDAEALDELRRSRQTLEKELRHPVRSFAFPNGDYAPRHMTLAQEAGYRYFFISTKVHPGSPEGRVFTRPCVHDNVGFTAANSFSPALFEMHLTGALDRLWRRSAAY